MNVKVGQRVKCPWDDGWHGSIMFGTVIQAGPRRVTIEWESGIRNYVGTDDIEPDGGLGITLAGEES